MGVKDAHVFPACSAPSSASGLSQWPKPRGPVGKLLISVGQALTYVMQPTKLHVERDDVRIPHRTQGENVGCARNGTGLALPARWLRTRVQGICGWLVCYTDTGAKREP